MIYRKDKGSALTHDELDNNFNELEKSSLPLNAAFVNKTAERSPNVNYVNDTNKLKWILLTAKKTYSARIDLYINNKFATGTTSISGSHEEIAHILFPVPVGASYNVPNATLVGPLIWQELEEVI